MSYKIRMALMSVVFGVVAGASQGAVILVDNFNEYTSSPQPYIGTTTNFQANPGGAFGIAGSWVRFGAATTDGIYSIAGGSQGRGASYSVGWTPANTSGSILYSFASAQNFSLLDDITLDLSLSAAVVGTTVAVQIRSGTTYYQSTTPLSLTNTTFSTFTFDASSTAMTRVAGGGSYESVASAVESIVFVFANTGGTGSQAIRFDNLNVVTVPEPSTVAALALGGGLLVGGRYLRRRRNG